MQSTWLEWFRASYPLIATIISFAGFATFLWLATKFVTKTAFDKHATDQAALEAHIDQRIDGLVLAMAEHSGRIKSVEEKMVAPPTRQEIFDRMAANAVDIASVKEGMKGVEKQLSTTNTYLQAILNNDLRHAAGSGR